MVWVVMHFPLAFLSFITHNSHNIQITKIFVPCFRLTVPSYLKVELYHVVYHDHFRGGDLGKTSWQQCIGAVFGETMHQYQLLFV